MESFLLCDRCILDLPTCEFCGRWSDLSDEMSIEWVLQESLMQAFENPDSEQLLRQIKQIETLDEELNECRELQINRIEMPGHIRKEYIGSDMLMFLWILKRTQWQLLPEEMRQEVRQYLSPKRGCFTSCCSRGSRLSSWSFIALEKPRPKKKGEEECYALHFPPEGLKSNSTSSAGYLLYDIRTPFQESEKTPPSEKPIIPCHVIKRLRIKGTKEMPDSLPVKGEIYYWDEGVGKNYGPIYSNRNVDNPPDPNHPAWRLARSFWPSRMQIDEFQEVSVPAKPPSRWWRVALYERPGHSIHFDEMQFDGVNV